MNRVLLFQVVAGIVIAATAADAQAPGKAPRFEVASIRPSPSVMNIGQQIEQGKLHVGIAIDQGRVDIGTLTVVDMISIAYRVKAYQAPSQDWMSAAHWDIVAKLPDGAPKDQVPEMLRALLEERFKLRVHTEPKEQNVYALVVGKDGLKLKAAAQSEPPGPGTSALAAAQGTITTNADGTYVISGPTGPMRVHVPSQQKQDTMTVEIPGVTMAGLADLLRPIADRPVMDMTGLRGVYTVSLELGGFDVKALTREAMGLGMMPDRPPNTAEFSDSALFRSVERLGLKLESRKMPIDTIVVDHVEKVPTEN